MDVNDDEFCLDKRGALAPFASKLAPTAMGVNDDELCLDKCGALTPFASKLAPTVSGVSVVCRVNGNPGCAR